MAMPPPPTSRRQPPSPDQVAFRAKQQATVSRNAQVKLERDVATLKATAVSPFPTYTVATAPSASDSTRRMIYVTDEVDGATLAFSDGTNWRRMQDRAVISA